MPGDKEARYVYTLKYITDVLKKIQETGRPDQLTRSYLRDTWLFKDNNYSAMIPLLKDMDFIDSTGVPTDLYAEFQNPSIAKKALGKGLKNAYPNLFKAYPNACSLPKNDIEGYFKQKTGKDKSVLNKIVGTFMTLCAEADMTSVAEMNLIKGIGKPTQEDGKGEQSVNTLLPISMNIQIVIPSDATSEQYDKIFSSIKKFLSK